MLVATAGHIDHGKTSLVRALTGVETDRLPDEKARGISIDLGFAYWPQPDGEVIGFVDVPGHERFVRNMVAGCCGVDCALIIVAANDGVMPQTSEHVRILDLLGIQCALVAITKCDLVEAARITEVAASVSALLAPTGMAGAPIFPLSCITGEGVAALSAALQTNRGESDRPDRPFRMAIDRAFSVTGAGTVAAGTVLAGCVQMGDRLTLAPAGKSVRVRSIQSAGRAREKALTGERCALNLAGLDLCDVHRGDLIIATAMHAPTVRIDARVTALDAPIRHGSRCHLHLGTADILAQVLVTGQTAIEPGTDAIAQLVLAQPASAIVGERFILRSDSGRDLIGGGRVIDPLATALRRKQIDRMAVIAALELGEAGSALAALLTIAGHEVDLFALEHRFNLSTEAAQALYHDAGMIILGKEKPRGLSADRIQRIEVSVKQALGEFHAAHPDQGGLAPGRLRAALAEPVSVPILSAMLKDMAARQAVALAGSLIKLPGHAATFTQEEIAMWSALAEWLETGGPRPFTLDEAVRETGMREVTLKAALYRRCANGDLLRMDDRRFVLSAHFSQWVTITRALGPGFSAAQFRDASGIGRNMVIRILEFLDASGMTRRNGDARTVVAD